MAIELKENVTQDGNVFYIHGINAASDKLLYCVEMNIKVPDFDLQMASIARRMFAEYFPQHIKA